MFLFSGLCACLATTIALHAQAIDLPIRYTLSITPLKGQVAPRVSVHLRFSGEPDGETVLELPDAWGGESALWRGIQQLRVSGGDMQPVAATDSARRRVRHRPNALITVSYDLVQDWAGVPTANGRNSYRPTVQPTYVHLLGQSTFVRPAWSLRRPVQFRRGAMPREWNFASDLEHAGTITESTLQDLLESITVAGDFRIVSRGPVGRQLRVALRGQWTFSDSVLITRLDRIVGAHRRFWNDADEPYLVTMLPLLGDAGTTWLRVLCHCQRPRVGAESRVGARAPAQLDSKAHWSYAGHKRGE
jgi:predicted metalloprotease with PDZ domain